MKNLSFVQRNQENHWVGDGFPVRNIFSYDDISKEMSPFLLLDYAGPRHFPPTEQRRGVGDHPHRGFETVTIVYSGEVEHKDSAGNGGKIGPGDVQWMTAASGVVHQEYHGTEFSKKGGIFEVVQLWVNLPKKDKMNPPAYQGLLASQIPTVELPDQSGSLRVIAGQYQDARGPAHTFTSMNVWDVRLKKGSHIELKVPNGWTCALFILKGEIRATGCDPVGEAEMAVFEREGTELVFEALENTTLLVLNGEPIPEPIVAAGPFVMNSQEEIRQAFYDYQNGKMGQIGRS